MLHRFTEPRSKLRTARLWSLWTLVLLGCGDPVSPRWAPAERIAGTWEWVSSLNVTNQRLHTPATDGFTAELILVAENDREGSFIYSRSGEQPVRGRFVITSEDAPGNDFITVDPGFDFITRTAWVSGGSDNLHIGGVFELGYNSDYVRARR